MRQAKSDHSALQDSCFQLQRQLVELEEACAASSRQLKDQAAQLKSQQQQLASEKEAAECELAECRKAALQHKEKAAAEREDLSGRLRVMQSECDAAQGRLRALDDREVEHRRALAQLDALVAESEMKHREIQSKISASRAEHKEVLTVLGAARAGKDASLREYAATAARLQSASPQSEWEGNALASLRLYLQQRQQKGGEGGRQEDGKIVVMAGEDFAALRERDRQRDEKTQRLQGELLVCQNLVRTLRQRMAARFAGNDNDGCTSATAGFSSSAAECELATAEQAEQEAGDLEDKMAPSMSRAACAGQDRTSLQGDGRLEEDEMGWGVMLLMDERARVRDVLAGNVAQPADTDARTEISTMADAGKRAEQTESSPTPRQLSEALAHLSPISSSSAAPGDACAHRDQAHAQEQGARESQGGACKDALPTYVSSPPPRCYTQGNLTQASMAATVAQAHTPQRFTPGEGCGISASLGTPSPAAPRDSGAFDGSTVSFSTPPTVRKLPHASRASAVPAHPRKLDAGMAVDEQSLAAVDKQLLGASPSSSKSFHVRIRERLRPARHVCSGSGTGAAQDSTHGFGGSVEPSADGRRYAAALRDKEVFDQGLSRLEAKTSMVVLLLACLPGHCLPCPPSVLRPAIFFFPYPFRFPTSAHPRIRRHPEATPRGMTRDRSDRRARVPAQ